MKRMYLNIDKSIKYENIIYTRIIDRIVSFSIFSKTIYSADWICIEDILSGRTMEINKPNKIFPILINILKEQK